MGRGVEAREIGVERRSLRLVVGHGNGVGDAVDGDGEFLLRSSLVARYSKENALEGS
jgi:hypothetical protein